MPRTPRVKPPVVPGKIVTASTAEEVTKLAAEATGPVVLDFVEEGCGACEEEAPDVEAIVAKCGGVTIIRADPTKDASLNQLAYDYNIEGFPTMFHAKTGADLKPGVASELADSDALRKLMKCPR